MTAKPDNGNISKEKYSTGQSHLWINSSKQKHEYTKFSHVYKINTLTKLV